MRKPRVFIASAAESLDIANAINSNLDHDTEVTLWKHGFSLSQNTIDELIKLASSVDFSIFVFTPDDVTNIRDQTHHVVRDNVVFEMGLFIGTLGKNRCFIVKPRNVDLHLPSDLLGLTPADYNGERSDNNLDAALNHPCALIKKEIDKIGLFTDSVAAQPSIRRNISLDYKIGDIEHTLLSKILESYTSSPDGVSAYSLITDLGKTVHPGRLSLAVIKLERVGFIDRKILTDEQYDYHALSITANGIDYLLANESHIFQTPVPKTIIKEDDIPF